MPDTYLDVLLAQRATLAEQRAAAVNDMEAATAAAAEESRSELTDDETAAFAAATDRVRSLDDQLAELAPTIADIEAVEARRAEFAPHVPNVIPSHNDEPLTARDLAHASRGEMRDRAMRVIENEDRASVVELRSDQKDKLDRMIRTRNTDLDGDYIARRTVLTENDAYRSAYAKSLLRDQVGFTPDEVRALEAFGANESRAASSTTTAGGFGVPVLIDPTITLTTQGHVPVVLQVCRHEMITTDTWKGVSSAGVTWSYDGEAAAVSDDAPTIAQPSVPVHEQRGFVPFSIRIGMDYPDFAGEMGRLLTEGYLDSAALHTATGTGTTQPFGIITALDANTNSEVTPTTDGALNGVDIDKVWGQLPERYRDQATWMMSTDVGVEIAAFGTATNMNFYSGDIRSDLTQFLRGRPVKYSDYFPAFTSSTGAAPLIVVGDFANYLWVTRAGMTTELVQHLFDTSNPGLPTGQRGLFAWARNGGDSINDVGFRLLGNQ